MIRSVEEVRAIIDGSENKLQSSGNSRQRRQPKRDTYDSTGYGESRISSFFQQQEKLPTAPKPVSHRNDSSPPRRGKTLGASIKTVIAPTPRSTDDSTSSQPSTVPSDVVDRDIPVLYRPTNPAKSKNSKWDLDGYICINSLTSQVLLKKVNKFSFASCPLAQFNMEKFNAGEEMTFDRYDIVKNE